MLQNIFINPLELQLLWKKKYWHSSYTQKLQKFGESKGFLPKTSKPYNPFAGWFGFDHIGVFNEKHSSSGLVYEKNSGEDQILNPLIFI
ncbi:hypothetical protein CAEBREN_01127 [Caenorhabditis brenneri]|uniref:Uncharacterized protein n=1 Tax=Caenorhabditis brenneri TaxID=135651 RepID=G0PH79_CAEBE|nr:hypothetical protein CAEBREN_01127 [Caenorhabditis brenneri]